jgi:hypothetical protein
LITKNTLEKYLIWSCNKLSKNYANNNLSNQNSNIIKLSTDIKKSALILNCQLAYNPLIYNNKDYLGFPYAPNFIEPASNKVSMLQINPKYDKIVVTPKANPFNTNAGAYPDMANGGTDLPF